ETWETADARPDLVAAIVSLEPSGPPFAGGRLWGPSIGPLTYDPPVDDPSELNLVQQSEPDAPDLEACRVQPEPARQLPRFEGVHVLQILSESSYHAPYDHCTAKVLSQAGVPITSIRLEDIGIHGNSHIFLVEENN